MLPKTLGHRVVTTPGGREALAWLSERKDFDLVILDQNMPGLNGQETLALLRKDDPLLPVLLATGNPDVRCQEALDRDPRLRLIAKPFSFKEIQGMLQVIAALPQTGKGQAR